MSNRLFPHNILPRQYGYLTRHAARSLITYYSYDFSDAAFNKTIFLPHGLGYAPIADMWIMFGSDTTGNPVADYPSTPDGIYHGPLELYHETGDYYTEEDAYSCATDDRFIYIDISHITATSGSKHVYFHVKLYADDFSATYFTPTETY